MSGPNDIAAPPPDRSHLVAEYVLGVLDPAQRSEVEMRIARDRAFAREVAVWQLHLAPLADEIESVEPPRYVFTRLQAALFERKRRGWLADVVIWRWLSAGAGAVAAAALAFAFVASRQPPAPTVVAPMVAAINLDDGKPAFLATIDLARGTMLVLPVSAVIPAPKVAELWLIPPGDKPHSLGVVDVAHPVSVTIPPALRSAVTLKAAMAISVEPPGGSPTGQPTGPVIAKGGISSI
ncbi:MAG TPA: anti-sigma factor [Rhodanobacteraceae bacterium]